MSFGDSAPMKRDTIFRIASITKPITAVGAMILVRTVSWRLDDSIEPWLPELANRRVLSPSLGSRGHRACAAPITVRDLLTYPHGLRQCDGSAGHLSHPEKIRNIGSAAMGPAPAFAAPGMDEWDQRARLAAVDGGNGRRWMYHTSADVLGALIARVSGQSLARSCASASSSRLGMKDTAFHVPSEKIERLPACYFFIVRRTRLECLTTDEQRMASGAAVRIGWWRAGLDAGGLLRPFSLMMLNKGRHSHEQILSAPP